MCGICGLFSIDGAAQQPEFAGAIQDMTRLLARRGPDDEGFWSDGRLQIGFRRLAILDLSPMGHQPMFSADQRSVLIFNGELYNYQELRRDLESRGTQFRSRSDTEVMLEALGKWGVAALQRFNGMFALAWYDRETHQLLLARDHAGIKPLYYFVAPGGRGVAFGSQYNCLLHTPWDNPGPMQLDVLRLYLRLHHIPPPYGLLANTYQLEPGHYLLLSADGTLNKQAWWTLPRDPEPDLCGESAVDALQAALNNAIRRQRLADVPLGVFLSGGIDSPLVAAVARQQTDSSLKAFTIGNPGWRQDESEAASAYARHLDLDHHLHNVSGVTAAQMMADVAAAQPEPFGDFSIIPTLLVSQAARTELTVALSGDGGDELFWGYERPLSLLRNGSDFRWPHALRLGLYAAGKLGIGPKRSDVIVARTPGHYYFDVNTRIKDADLHQIAPELPGLPEDFSLYTCDRYVGTRHLSNFSRWAEFYGQMQRGLKKVDMASMFHSLEVRVPLLDREVIEVSIRLDPQDVMRNHTRKRVLRDLLSRYVPATSIPQSKLGFAVPLGDWLSGPLRPLVQERLLSGHAAPQGVFDDKALRAYCEGHFRGEADRKWGIWTLLTLQMWADEHLSAASSR